MHPPYKIPIWKQAPSIRLIIPLIAGIILQWYLSFSILYILLCVGCFLLAVFLFTYFSSGILYRLFRFRGISIHLLLISFGMLLTWQKDARHQSNWYGHYLTDSSKLWLKIRNFG